MSARRLRRTDSVTFVAWIDIASATPPLMSGGAAA